MTQEQRAWHGQPDLPKDYMGPLLAPPHITIDNWAALIHLIRTKGRAAIFWACKWTIIAIVAVVVVAAALTIIML